MRYALILVGLLSFSAVAEEDGLLFRVRCDGTNIVIGIKANKVGIYELPPIPHDICGKDV